MCVIVNILFLRDDRVLAGFFLDTFFFFYKSSLTNKYKLKRNITGPIYNSVNTTATSNKIKLLKGKKYSMLTTNISGYWKYSF